MAIALVIGNMVGSGIFLLPSSLAAAAGPVSIIGWIFTGVGAILLALVFARVGRTFPRTGGPYAYARRAFGDFIGFQTAWGYWIAAWAGNALMKGWQHRQAAKAAGPPPEGPAVVAPLSGRRRPALSGARRSREVTH